MSRTRPPTRLLPAVAGVAILAGSLSACGSTVQAAGVGQAGTGLVAGSTTTSALGTAGQADQTVAAGAPVAGGGVPQPAAAAAGGSTGRTAGSQTATAGSAGQGGGVTSGGSAASYARGVTAKTITIGVLYPQGFDQAASALGFGGATSGDVKAEAQAIINQLNKEGGIAGRQIVPVWAQQKSLSNQDQTPALCAQLTQDNKVFAVVSVLNMTDEWLGCFRKAGMPLLDDAAGVSAAELKGLRVISAGEPLQERLYRGVLNRMINRGFLTSTSRIGLLWLDTPGIRQLATGTVAGYLKAAGLNIASQFAAPDDNSQISSYSNAVLQFRSANVDRVISVGTSPLFFMHDASSQHYYPGYVLSSEYGPGALLELAAPKDQLANSVGAGWEPFVDVDSAHNPGPVGKNETRCFTIMRQGGQSSTSTLTEALQVQLCDAFFVMQSALASSAVPTTVPGLIQGTLGLGDSYLSSATFRTSFANRLDGPAATRDFSYSQSCSCFSYDRPLAPMQ